MIDNRSFRQRLRSDHLLECVAQIPSIGVIGLLVLIEITLHIYFDIPALLRSSTGGRTRLLAVVWMFNSFLISELETLNFSGLRLLEAKNGPNISQIIV